MSYVHRNDREGAIGFSDCLRDCETLADVHGVLHGVLLTRFEVDVKECPTAVNLEDREQAIENLHRYGFGTATFDAAFPEVMAYALHNRHPEDVA